MNMHIFDVVTLSSNKPDQAVSSVLQDYTAMWNICRRELPCWLGLGSGGKQPVGNVKCT